MGDPGSDMNADAVLQEMFVEGMSTCSNKMNTHL